ncbi:MAG: LamG domain-containing protein [bacterium]|nr:LamG domain-containing protein [bacterium]
MKRAAPLKKTIPAISLGITLALAPMASAQQCVENPPGSIGWWPGDGSASDLESGRDARPTAGAGYAMGLVGDAFGFDGVGGGQDDRVLLPRLAADGLADLTVEFWINTTDPTAGLLSAANGNPSSANELLLFQGTAGLVVWIKQSQSGSIPVFVNDGAWHHVALVREGGEGSLFVDGLVVDRRAYPAGPLDVGPLGLLLGQDQDCLGGCFQADQALDGAVDELTIYGRALAEQEIAAVFEAGAAGKCKPLGAPDAPGTEALAEELTIAFESIEALEMEMGMLIDRIGEIDLLLENLEASLHSHDAKPRIRSRWGHDRRRHHDDDDDDDRDRKKRKHRKHGKHRR